MPTTMPTDLLRTADAISVTPDALQVRLVEAASYAVLRRIAPALRHDVAGFMQPVGMLVMVLQRRAQMPEPDLQAISKTLASVSALAKEATTGCMNAMDWLASHEDTCVSMRAGADEVVRLLALEMSGCGLSASHDIAENQACVSRRFFRNVLVAALLAWRDQKPGAGVLRISGSADAQVVELKIQFESDGTALAAAAVSPQRPIGWNDVETLAGACGATLSKGDDWLRLQLRPSSGDAANRF